MVLIHSNRVITWGVVKWVILEGQLLLYEKEDIVETFHIVPPLVQMVQPFLFDRLQIRDAIVLIVSLTMFLLQLMNFGCSSFIRYVVNMKVLQAILIADAF